MSAYVAGLNVDAVVRDYAIQFMSNLTVTTVDSVKLQASVVAQLTSVPNELTRQAVVGFPSVCQACSFSRL